MTNSETLQDFPDGEKRMLSHVKFCPGGELETLLSSTSDAQSLSDISSIWHATESLTIIISTSSSMDKRVEMGLDGALELLDDFIRDEESTGPSLDDIIDGTTTILRWFERCMVLEPQTMSHEPDRLCCFLLFVSMCMRVLASQSLCKDSRINTLALIFHKSDASFSLLGMGNTNSFYVTAVARMPMANVVTISTTVTNAMIIA